MPINDYGKTGGWCEIVAQAECCPEEDGQMLRGYDVMMLVSLAL
jgi:hypothetical protein